MPFSLKQKSIEAFFSEFRKRVERLKTLRSQSFEDEAFTLCLVYIDRLASGHYGGKYRQNRKNFCRALKELSGNPVFGMIHPAKLLENTNAGRWASATSVIKSIIDKRPRALLEEEQLEDEIRRSQLVNCEKVGVISDLWRASIASISYDYIRNAEVHGPGSGGLSFDSSVYNGQQGVTLDFKVFFAALGSILSHVEEISVRTGEWFGNLQYLKERR